MPFLPTFKKRFLFVIRSFIVSYQKVMTNCKKTVRLMDVKFQEMK